MIITSVKRQANDPLTNEVRTELIAVINGKEMSVPLDPANRHYAAILEWVAEGNKIQDAD